MQLPVTGLRPPWGAGGGDSAKRLKWDRERRGLGVVVVGEENKHYSEKWLPDDPDFSEFNSS